MGVAFPLPTVKSLIDKGVKSHRLKLDGHAFVLSILRTATQPRKDALHFCGLERAKKPAGFCTQGSFDFDGVQISIDGVGPLKLPFRTTDARKLSQVAVQAPYGKQTETLVDTNVRDTLEIPAEAVTYSEELRDELKNAIANIAEALQLDHDRLECELYKLLRCCECFPV